MPHIVRPATAADAPAWLDLLKSRLGSDYPFKSLYDPAWIARELSPASGHTTWVAASGSRINAAITLLKSASNNHNAVGDFGRNIFRPECFADQSGSALIQEIAKIAAAKHFISVVRIQTNDIDQQKLFEEAGWVCAGLQPLKHLFQQRSGVLFYIRPENQESASASVNLEVLPLAAELVTAVLRTLQGNVQVHAKEGVVGYPLQSDLTSKLISYQEYQTVRARIQASNPASDVSSGYICGHGFFRANETESPLAVVGERDGQTVAGAVFYIDEIDRAGRILDAFSVDDVSLGAVLQFTIQHLQEKLSAAYTEIDVLGGALKLQKTLEQLGFAPVAFFPGFFTRASGPEDILKMTRLNVAYSVEAGSLTAKAKVIGQVIDNAFRDQKIGLAVINLLRGLPIFAGLGDGELRKIARLFTQKLYRPGEVIFKRGDSGEEAFVVMRGQIDILLEEGTKPIASLLSGKVFGELAFLDGSPRNAFALAGQASILLVVQRSALNELTQREPHLGMVVMRNIAVDLSNKLRNANSVIAGAKK